MSYNVIITGYVTDFFTLIQVNNTIFAIKLLIAIPIL